LESRKKEMGMCGATQGEGVQKTVKLRIWGRVALVESDDVDDSVFFSLPSSL
jgi:hypothetical protein